MKKLLLLTICFLSGITSFAQEIEYDKTENGERSIMCKYENVRSMKDKTVFSVSHIWRVSEYVRKLCTCQDYFPHGA